MDLSFLKSLSQAKVLVVVDVMLDLFYGYGDSGLNNTGSIN